MQENQEQLTGFSDLGRIIEYKKQCYDALYTYFSDAQTFLKQKQLIIDAKTEEYFTLQKEFRDSQKRMLTSKKELQDILAFDYEHWLSNSRQLIIPFDLDEEKGGAL